MGLEYYAFVFVSWPVYNVKVASMYNIFYTLKPSYSVYFR